MRKKIDLTGAVFGKLTVTGLSHRNAKKEAVWNCSCSCGGAIQVRGSCLTGIVRFRSCGCNKGHWTHRLTERGKKSGLYGIWTAMKNRCYNPNSEYYADYGGRGIKVCDRWKGSFESFFEDLGDRPKGMTLERIDNNGDYGPSNCHWATRKDQARNRRSNVILEFQGRSQILDGWAKEIGIEAATIRRRLALGWTMEKALTSSVKSQILDQDKADEIRELLRKGLSAKEVAIQFGVSRANVYGIGAGRLWCASKNQPIE